jgi:hypothetical protein
MSSSLAHLANIAQRTGRMIYFDPDKEQVLHDAEANKMLTRSYRAPYSMPDKV